MFEKASAPIDNEPGVMVVTEGKLDDFIEEANQHRIWNRKGKVR